MLGSLHYSQLPIVGPLLEQLSARAKLALLVLIILALVGAVAYRPLMRPYLFERDAFTELNAEIVIEPGGSVRVLEQILFTVGKAKDAYGMQRWYPRYSGTGREESRYEVLTARFGKSLESALPPIVVPQIVRKDEYFVVFVGNSAQRLYPGAYFAQFDIAVSGGTRTTDEKKSFSWKVNGSPWLGAHSVKLVVRAEGALKLSAEEQIVRASGQELQALTFSSKPQPLASDDSGRLSSTHPGGLLREESLYVTISWKE